MHNKFVNLNEKTALNQMKMEISKELGVDSNQDDASLSSYENGLVGSDLGSLMSKELIKMGEEALLRQYNSKK